MGKIVCAVAIALSIPLLSLLPIQFASLNVPGWSFSAGLFATSAEAWSNPHGSYDATTGLCAACHRAHSASGPAIMAASNVRNLCDSCHQGYQGSDYDVEGGTIRNGGANSPSISGGFSAAGVTSEHLIDTSGNPLRVPGGASSSTTLTCVSCHNPHGSSNYRLFRQTVTWNGLNASVPNFTTTLSNRLATETVVYQTGSIDACDACHSDYSQRVGGSYSAGFRHKVGVTISASNTPGSLPLEQQSPANRIVCLTCHNAHSTKVTNTANGGRQGFSTALKRYTDSGMCSGCHFNQW